MVLVDPSDRTLGEAEKLAAHRDGGKLHRAFSIFLENDRGEQLLQQRAASKYHFRGLWANACCGHPLPGEPIANAARRRLREELGIDAELRESFSFLYTAEDPGSGLTERELDHVFVGRFDGLPQPHPDEIDAVRWVAPKVLERELRERPERFAPWLHEAAPRVLASRKGEWRASEPIESQRRRRLAGVAAALVAVFLALVLMLPTPTDEPLVRDELAGSLLPGHSLLVHAGLWLFGLEPTAHRLVQVNLAIHLTLALLLALLAHQLALLARPESVRWPGLAALGCGLFVLLFPPILHWGRSASGSDFAMLPLLLVAVGGRWLRASLPSERQGRIDWVVRVAVFLGTITDLLFWVLVPYLLLQRGLRARNGSPRTSNPWRTTLAVPCLAALASLLLISVERGQTAALTGSVGRWAVGTPDAFALLGVFCTGLALVNLLPRRRREGFPWMARGVLLDLLVPGLLLTVVRWLAPAARDVAPMPFVPFVALGWTLLTPLTIDGLRGGFRKLAWGLFGVLSVLLIWPGSNDSWSSRSSRSPRVAASGASVDFAALHHE